MVGHVLDLAPDQRRELLALLTQERTDLQTDEEVLAELSETLRRQLSLGAATDLAEGFRRRMIRITEELGDDHPPGYYDFRSDRAIAEDVLERVGRQAETLSKSDHHDDFMVDFAKTFRTMSQDRRAAWLRGAAVAASTAEKGEADPQRAADAALRKSSADETAESIASDVAGVDAFAMAMAYRAARDVIAAGAKKAAPPLGVRPAALAAAAAPLGLVAGGAVAYAIRKRRVTQRKARDAADVQVRRERQATQAVVTTCAYILACAPT
jgi:hypothetical protein